MPDAAQDNVNAEYPVNERGRVYSPNATDDEKTWAMLSHLSLLGHLVVPFFAIIASIVILNTKGKTSAYVADHARDSINFQITLLLYSVFAIPLAFVTCGLGGLLAVLVYPLGIVGVIMAAVAANRGEFFRYPMTFRLIH